MRTWAGRALLAAGLVANAAVVPHPLALAIAQTVVALVVLSGRGRTAWLALAALLLVPAPVAGARRWLSKAPLTCNCNRSSGQAGPGALAGAAVDVGLIALAVWLAKHEMARPTGAAKES
jgi:hypothetical protein